MLQPFGCIKQIFRKMKNIIFMVFIAIASVFVLPEAVAQQVLSKTHYSERTADSLFRSYRFKHAAEIYKHLAKEADLSAKNRLEIKIVTCQNGEAMLQFVSNPKVVLRKALDKRDFFLYYPNINSLGHFILRADASKGTSDTLYVPNNTDRLYYSAKDQSGNWNIYVSKRQENGNWGDTQILNNNITSSGNEIFPFVSPDGKRLYFSSNGHYGAGGYDLYVCLWDEEKRDWGVPQNLGFPYSSPADDFFFYITPDEKYATFSSTRQFADPSSRYYSTTRVFSYVVEYETDPVKYKATPDEAANIALLRIAGNTQENRDSLNKTDIAKALEGVERKTGVSQMDSSARKITEKYTLASQKYRKLKKQLSTQEKNLNSNRSLYSQVQRRLGTETAQQEKEIKTDSLNTLAKSIADSEASIMSLSKELRNTEHEIEQIERVFLASGIEVPANTLFKTSEELAAEALAEDSDNNIEISQLLDNRAKVSENNTLSIESIKPKTDLSFKITKGATPLSLEYFPAGIVYQIRIASAAKKLSTTALKGLYPVFERREGGRYTYSVGVYYSHAEANQYLSRVKKAGFPSAYITAYEDGKTIALAAAKKKSSYYNVVVYCAESSLPLEVIKAISSTGKDLAKTSTTEGFKFIAGPFSSQQEANELAKNLKDIADKNLTKLPEMKISVEPV